MKFRDNPYDRLPMPRFLRGCFAEGEGGDGDGGGSGGDDGAGGGGNGVDHWSAGIADEGLRGAVSAFESRDKALEAIGYTAPDWREAIQDEEARKFADSSTDPTDFAKRGLEMRQKLTKALVVPGKNASEDEVAEFRGKINKILNVPAEASAYEFDVPQGYQLTELDKQVQETWRQRFLDLELPADKAKALSKFVYEDAQTLAAEDEKFAKESEAVLKREWGPDAEANDGFAHDAASKLLGGDFEEVSAMTTKADRLVLDHPAFKRMFAKIGREMQEGRVTTMSDDARQTINERITELRKQQEEARADRDSKRANDLYKQEMALIAQRDGEQPVVGAQGRVT